jgi:hypothetical protein
MHLSVSGKWTHRSVYRSIGSRLVFSMGMSLDQEYALLPAAAFTVNFIASR